MDGYELRRAGLLLGTNPHSAGASDQRERIVANDFGRSFDLEPDGIIGEGANGAEFVSHADNNSGRISAVSDQLRIIGAQDKLAVHAAARKILGYDLLALDVPLDAQIAPLMKEISHFEDKRWISQMLKLVAVRIDLGHQLVIDVELQMVAVGADYRF